MTPDQHILFQRLAKCSMLPGSWEKRFVRYHVALPETAELSDKQIACLERIAHRYRDQLAGKPPKGRRRWRQP